MSHFIIDCQRPPDRPDEREGSTCKESTIVADSSCGVMYGGEAEHDGCMCASQYYVSGVFLYYCSVSREASGGRISRERHAWFDRREERGELFIQSCTNYVHARYRICFCRPSVAQGQTRLASYYLRTTLITVTQDNITNAKTS